MGFGKMSEKNIVSIYTCKGDKMSLTLSNLFSDENNEYKKEMYDTKAVY
jgi:hypothetical protein